MPRLSFSGFDRATEAQVRALFDGLGLTTWSASDEATADAVLIDLDSIYGQMAWLKGLAGGAVAIGVTSALRADTPYRLPAGFDAEALAKVLNAITTANPGTRPETRAESNPETSGADAMAPTRTGARLVDHLAAAAGAFAVAPAGLPRLVIDPARQQFAPGTSLKALIGYATADLPAEAITPIAPADVAATLKQAGDPQPLARLTWLLALGGGEGKVQGYGPATRFGLGKWPQAEREFPKHFRIATVMLKAPGTVAEIVAASGASEADVADYINAALAAGHATTA